MAKRKSLKFRERDLPKCPTEMMEQVGQSGNGCPIPEDIQSQAGQDSGHLIEL